MIKCRLLKIDAWNYGEDDEYDWFWNETFHLKSFALKDFDRLKYYFLKTLKEFGVVCKQGACRVTEEYGDGLLVLELKKTGEPLYALTYFDEFDSTEMEIY